MECILASRFSSQFEESVHAYPGYSKHAYLTQCVKPPKIDKNHVHNIVTMGERHTAVDKIARKPRVERDRLNCQDKGRDQRTGSERNADIAGAGRHA
jgi:hypothetical protein